MHPNRPRQISSRYLNEEAQVAPPSTPLVIQEGGVTRVADCATINFANADFDIAGFGAQANVSDIQPVSAGNTQRGPFTQASAEITNQTNLTACSITVPNSFIYFKGGKGIYTMTVYGSVTGTGAGGPSFRVNTAGMWPDYPGVWPGFSGWNINGAYSNPGIIAQNAVGTSVGNAVLTWLSATVFSLSFKNSGSQMFFSWTHTWIQ